MADPVKQSRFKKLDAGGFRTTFTEACDHGVGGWPPQVFERNNLIGSSEAGTPVIAGAAVARR